MPVHVEWRHLPGDCTSFGTNYDDWDESITKALQWVAARLVGALMMLAVMWDESEEYRRYLWDFGYGTTGEDQSADPSMYHWFGRYDELKLDIITEVIWWAYVRITQAPQIMIRCLNTSGPVGCWGDSWAFTSAATYGTDVGTVNLCPEWYYHTPGGDAGIPDRGSGLLHELLHFGLPHRIVNMPHDVREYGCKEGSSWKCYRPDGPLYLWQHEDDITRIFYDHADNKSHTRTAMLSNVDNYTMWIQNRFARWGACMFPEGAVAP